MRSPLEPSVVYDFGLLENKNEKAAFAHYMEGAVRSDAAMQFRVALGYRAGRLVYDPPGRSERGPAPGTWIFAGLCI